MVAECDPSGGDLAARFGLSSKRGWPTWATAVRRSGTSAGIEPHLQQLPGGLDVLVGPGGSNVFDSIHATDELLANISNEPGGVGVVLADVGRLPQGDLGSSGWLARSDAVVIVLRGDVTSVLHVRNRARDIQAVCGDGVALAVVGTTGYRNEEIAQFTGISVIGNLPFDPETAAVATGAQGSERRLARSLLIHSALRLAESLCGDALDPVRAGDPMPVASSVERTQPANPSSLAVRPGSSLRRCLGSLRLLRSQPGVAQRVPALEQHPEDEGNPERQREVSA